MKKILLLFLSFFGLLFVTAYVRSAAVDVVYTDYIRLINSYLTDVFSIEPYLGLDVFTRIPINYIQRIINVVFFDYSTMFDMMLGCVGLFGCGVVLSKYCGERDIKLGISIVILLFVFSLNKWEMLLNGSGWVHFVAVALFYYYFRLYDKYTSYQGRFDEVMVGMAIDGGSTTNSDRSSAIDGAANCSQSLMRKLRRKLYALPSIIILLFSGPYCVAFAVTLLLFIGSEMVCDMRRKRSICAAKPDEKSPEDSAYAYDRDLHRSEKLARNEGLTRHEEIGRPEGLAGPIDDKIRHNRCMLLAVGLPLVLYCISNACAVESHAGATEMSLAEVITKYPAMIPRLFINSFASMMFGEDVISQYAISDRTVIIAGMTILLFYVLAIVMVVRGKIYRQTTFPIMMLCMGFISHILVTYSRWIFLNSSYTLSSRYALQFQSGLIGVLLVSSLYAKAKRTLPAFVICAIVLSSCIMNGSVEIHLAPYRKENYTAIRECVLNYESYSDEQLQSILQYHHGGDRIRNALSILKTNGWNVFSQ